MAPRLSKLNPNDHQHKPSAKLATRLSHFAAPRSVSFSHSQGFIAPSMRVSSLAGAMLHTSIRRVILSRGHAHTPPRLAEESLQESHKPKHVPAPGRDNKWTGLYWTIPSVPLQEAKIKGCWLIHQALIRAKCPQAVSTV